MYTTVYAHDHFKQQTALMRAQQAQMELLVENILMYMQAVHDPHLSEVRLV